jgi:hypothetical protein
VISSFFKAVLAMSYPVYEALSVDVRIPVAQQLAFASNRLKLHWTAKRQCSRLVYRSRRSTSSAEGLNKQLVDDIEIGYVQQCDIYVNDIFK